MKKIILFFILSIFCFSHEIIIDETFSSYKHHNDSNFFISDKEESIFEILTKEFETINTTSFKKTKNHIWTRFKIKNTSDQKKIIFFKNKRAGIDYIDVFILKDKKVIKTFLLGDLREQSKREILSKKSTFVFELDSNSSYEIYVKYKSLGAISNQWDILIPKIFFKSEYIETMIWSFFIGLVFAIILYNMMFFFNTKNFAFLFYILSSFSSLGYLLSLNGVLYEFDIGLNLYFLTISTWYFAYGYFIFTLLFIIIFFNENKTTRSYKIIRGLVLLQIFILILLSIGFYDNTYHYTFSKLDVFALLSTFLILIFAVVEFIKNKTASIYFLIGQIVYVSCFSYFTLEVIGIIPIQDYSWLILPLGLCFEILLISFALNSKLKIAEKEKENIQQILLEESRFINAGKTISYIIHQIKNPIAQLGSQINLIEATLLLNNSELENVIRKKLPKIKDTFEYINEVSHSVNTLFLNPNGKEIFNIQTQINKLLFLQKDILDLYKINVTTDLKDIDIHSFKGTFSNIFMVILENSIYELKNKDYEKTVHISSLVNENNLIIIMEDNAGGIKNIDDVFDINYTSKEKEGSGLGLALAKTLITKKLEGKMSVKNTKEGACFSLLIPF